MTPLAISTAALAGFALGLAQHASLRRNVELYVARGLHAAAVGLHLARAATAVIAWVVVARAAGAAGLLAAFIGFLAARQIAMRRVTGSR